MAFTAATDALGLFLKRLSDRSPLGPDERAAVLRLPAVPRKIGGHRDLVHLGQPVEHCCLVGEGLVARFSQIEDGKRQVISFHIPGDMVDLYSLLLPSAPSALQTLPATTIFQVPHSALREAAARYPALASAFWRDCVVDGLIVAEWLVSIGRREARARLAHLFCEMAVRFDQIGRRTSGGIVFPVTQDQLADALGLTSVHVNRVIKSLREEGVLAIARADVRILDWNALVSIAQFDPAYLQLPAGASRGGASPLPRIA